MNPLFNEWIYDFHETFIGLKKSRMEYNPFFNWVMMKTNVICYLKLTHWINALMQTHLF